MSHQNDMRMLPINYGRVKSDMMEYVRDWKIIDKGKTIFKVKCKMKRTVLLFNLNRYELKIIKELDKEMKIKFVVCESMGDLLALPAFMCVVNLNGTPKKELDEHFDFMYEWFDDCPYLFTGRTEQSVLENFPNTNIVIRTPFHFNKGFLKAIIKSFHLLTEE